MTGIAAGGASRRELAPTGGFDRSNGTSVPRRADGFLGGGEQLHRHRELGCGERRWRRRVDESAEMSDGRGVDL